MYLFSMPNEEAKVLAGSDRYLKTILISILMIYMTFFIKSFSDSTIKERTKSVSVGVMILCIFSFSYISQGKINFVPSTIQNSEERVWIENNMERYMVPLNGSYCILIPQDDGGYSYVLLKYIFGGNAVSTKCIKNVDDLNSIHSQYIFVYDRDNEIINAWIKDNYPEVYGNEVIYCGEISDD